MSAFLLVILAAFVGGSNPIISKVGLREFPPFSLVAIRFLIALVFLLPGFLSSKIKINRQFWYCLFISLLSSANIILFSFGIKSTGANIGQTIYTAIPIITAIIMYLLTKDSYGFKKTLGIIIGFIGTIFVVFLPTLTNKTGITSGTTGNLLILTGALSYTTYSIISKKLQQYYTTSQIVTIFVLTTFIVSLPFSISDTFSHPLWWQGVSFTGLSSVIFSALVSTIAYYQLVQLIIKKTGPVVASTVLYLQPVATFIWSYLVLGETLSISFILAFLMVIFGVWLTSTQK